MGPTIVGELRPTGRCPMAVTASPSTLDALGHVETLESQLKAICYRTGQIVDFHTRVAAANLSNYAPHAPASSTRALKESLAAYQGTCDALELQILRAQAVIDRDEKRAKGTLVAAAAKTPGTDMDVNKPPETPSQYDLFGDAFYADTPAPTLTATPIDAPAGFSLPVDASAIQSKASSFEVDLASLGKAGEPLDVTNSTTEDLLNFDIDAFLASNI